MHKTFKLYECFKKQKEDIMESTFFENISKNVNVELRKFKRIFK